MEQIIYTKYSTDRVKDFMIRTDKRLEEGRVCIKKVALFDEGIDHLNHMVSMYNKMSSRYDGVIKVSKSEVNGRELTNEFVEGESLLELMEHVLDKRDKDELLTEIEKFYSAIRHSDKELNKFEVTPEFTKVFGEADELNFYDKLEDYDLLCADVTDVDMTFENIIVADDGTWQLIDYEWTFDFPIPEKFVLYRTLWYWYNSTEADTIIPWHDITKWADIPHELEMSFRHMEVHLQQYISGDTASIEKLIAESEVENIPHNFLIDKATFYEEGVWYKNNYNKLKVQHSMTERAYQDALLYRKAFEDTVAKYNNLQRLYVNSQAHPEDRGIKGAIKRFAKKLLGR